MTNSNIKFEIIDNILELYNDRSLTQKEIAKKINHKYNVSLNESHVREITSQAGYYHTIKRGHGETIAYFLSDSFVKALK